MDYQEYKRDFLEMLRNDSAIAGTYTEDEFIDRTLELLSTFDEIEDPIRIGNGDKKGRGGRLMRVDGYCVDETDHSLILFISDFQDSFEPQNLTMSRVDELYWRMYYFLDEVCNGKINEYYDDSDEILKISRMIKSRLNAEALDPNQILKIKLFILTNKELDTKLLDSNLLISNSRKTKGNKKETKTNKKIKKADFNGKPLEINLWYPERFYQMEMSNSSEPIVLDFERDFTELGYKGIPCIKGNIGDNLGYEAYIAIIPGKLLASIYIEHGSKVLEGNVRAFLGTNGSKSVNSGIKKTINNDPTKFFTYNNGIATTASDVTIENVDGEMLITRVVDLQIINGGQTTASLAEAVLKKTNVSLDGIFVPMKLTVIEDRETETEDGIGFYDQMVKDIAKYANSQNKVTAADLFSNDPFHIWMERMSKKLLAPPAKFAVPTGWYYERSRKKYQQEQIKLRTDEAKRFGLKYPKNQIITKEQLAMYLTTLSCKPHIVSKGKNWVMKEFGVEIGEVYKEDKGVFNEYYFKKCICAAIIFRAVDGYLEINKDSAKKPTGFWYKAGGYKLNIVPYSIAKIISSIPNGYSLDWNLIWQKQSLTPTFMREIEKVTKMTNDFICDSHGMIVTEYCKKEDTWKNYRDNVKYEPSKEFIDELISESLLKSQEAAAQKDERENKKINYLVDLVRFGDRWMYLKKVGNERGLLNYQENSLLDIAIKATQTGILPSMPQARKIMAIKDKLETEGIK